MILATSSHRSLADEKKSERQTVIHSGNSGSASLYSLAPGIRRKAAQFVGNLRFAAAGSAES